MDSSAVPVSLDGLRFAVVDIETTGLHAHRHRILQLAVVTVDAAGNRLDEWSSYARPRFLPVARLGPRDIHGITRRDLRGAPPPARALAELAKRLDGAVLTAHNLDFDGAFLRRNAQRYGIDLPVGLEMCTLTLSRSLDPERRLSHRLGDMCARYGIEVDRPHDALADAQATAAALPHLLSDGHIESWEQLAALATPKPPRPPRQRR